MPGKVPEDKKAVYYINFSSPEGYKDLIIKKICFFVSTVRN